MPDFEWDENKNRINLKIHGIEFQTARKIWDDPQIRVFVGQTVDDELRYMALGIIDVRVYAAIFTRRMKRVRLISARPASRKERALYEKE